MGNADRLDLSSSTSITASNLWYRQLPPRRDFVSLRKYGLVAGTPSASATETAN
jgi:hypothetical protein